MRANREWKRKLSNGQKSHIIGVVVITKNQDNSIVPLTGEDAIIVESSGTFLGLAGAEEVNKDNDGKPTL